VDSNINSENHVLIVDPRLGNRIKKEDTKWLPVPLIMALTRSTGNAIDMQVPIRGSLSDPKFKFWPIVEEVIRNIFIKPPSAGYLLHVKNVEREVEKSLSLTWPMRQTALDRKQERFIGRIADFLHDNPEASISVTPINYTEKEKEHLLLFEARKKYWMTLVNKKKEDFTEEDSLYVDKMSVKDSAFVRFLSQKIGDSMIYTVQEKCIDWVGNQAVNTAYARLLKAREQTFRSYFDEGAKITFRPGENIVPFNGFSYYKIDYPGEIPEALRKAYEELLELNEEKPREKYRDKRKARVQMLREERARSKEEKARLKAQEQKSENERKKGKD
jgi:hypothetical protein